MDLKHKMAMNITYSKSFIVKAQSLSNAEKKLIGDFITSLKGSGFRGLPGRNKPSTGVSKNHVDRVKLIQYALLNGLCHYHIGHKSYNTTKPFGDWTSEFVVHYSNKNPAAVKLVAYGGHPPFKLPRPNELI